MKRVLLALGLMAALAGAVAFVHFRRELYRPYRGTTGNVVVIVAPGEKARDLAQTLVERGVLERRLPFLLRYILGRPRHHLKAGEYLFDRPLRPIDVYEKLIRGDIYLHPVLIPEGSDRFDIAFILHRDMNINAEEFLRETREASLIRDLDPQATSLEGYLFPDTYRFPRGVTPATVIEAMLARFRHIVQTHFARDLEQGGTSLHAVVTLASLVEKETPDPSERPIVAGVFARRLERKIQLACDPTVVYAARLDHRMLEHPTPPITRSELAFDSPYNTYLHTGLPPGPIANPGIASLRAALAPAPGDVLYFVSNNHGGHVFARTLAEHERNVARYRRQVAELRSQAQQATSASGRPSTTKDREGSHATNPSSKRGQKQKTTDSRTPAGAHPGTGGGH